MESGSDFLGQGDGETCMYGSFVGMEREREGMRREKGREGE